MIAPATQLCPLNRGSTNPSGTSPVWMPPGARLSLHFSTGKTGDEI